MIKIKNNYYRNLEEQVQFLTEYHNVNQGLVQWGIRVVGQVETSEDLPVPYDGEYGDAIAVGTEAPYYFYIWTRASIEGEPAYWFPFGEISIVGPEGPKGDKGEQGIPGPSSMWYAGTGAPTTTTGYRDGDMYLATNGQIFRFENNTWNSVTNIKGAQGIQGIPGPKGETGPAGPQGPKGETGDVGGFINIAGIINDFDEYGNPILPTPSELNDLTKAYLVGASTPYDLYVQIGSTSATATWNNVGPFNAATLVTSGGVGLNIFDADTKLDKFTNTGASRVYFVSRQGENSMKQIFDTAALGNISGMIPLYFDKASSVGYGSTLTDEKGVLLTNIPNQPYQCANKKYVDDITVNKLDKVESTTTNDQAYIKTKDGNQAMVDLSTGGNSWIAGAIPRFSAGGCITVGTPTWDTAAANKQYVDTEVGKCVQSITGNTGFVYLYTQNASGTDTKKIVATTTNLISNGNIAQYFTKTSTSAGANEPSGKGVLVTSTPTQNFQCAPKKYVDDKITGIFSLDGTTLTITTA